MIGVNTIPDRTCTRYCAKESGPIYGPPLVLESSNRYCFGEGEGAGEGDDVLSPLAGFFAFFCFLDFLVGVGLGAAV
jgi:hypothetical protein